MNSRCHHQPLTPTSIWRSMGVGRAVRSRQPDSGAIHFSAAASTASSCTPSRPWGGPREVHLELHLLRLDAALQVLLTAFPRAVVDDHIPS